MGDYQVIGEPSPEAIERGQALLQQAARDAALKRGRATRDRDRGESPEGPVER